MTDKHYIVAKCHPDLEPTDWYVIMVTGDKGQVLSVHSYEEGAWTELERLQLLEAD